MSTIVPNQGGPQPASTPEPNSGGPTVLLIVAGACGGVFGYLANDWRAGAEVFATIVAAYNAR